jgi:hypothetical protein
VPRIVRHVWPDTTTANAFVAGVEWVNDSALEVIDILVGDTATVVVEDEDGFGDVTIDHTEPLPVEVGTDFVTPVVKEVPA